MHKALNFYVLVESVSFLWEGFVIYYLWSEISSLDQGFLSFFGIGVFSGLH